MRTRLSRRILRLPPFITAPISDRFKFGELLTRYGLTGDAVEIGTHRGEFAKHLLSQWDGRLYCVDPWADVDGYDDLLTGTDRESDYAICRGELSRFSARAEMIRMTSEQFAPFVQDESLAFCYIDGDHREEMVRRDIALWWPKIKRGGILAGHDLWHEKFGAGVIAAVTEHAERVLLPVGVVREPYESWLIQKV